MLGLVGKLYIYSMLPDVGLSPGSQRDDDDDDDNDDDDDDDDDDEAGQLSSVFFRSCTSMCRV